jgi:hypothetical protein
MNQYIFYNKFILSNNIYLKPENSGAANLTNIKILDILKGNGTLFDYRETYNKFQIYKISYNTIISAIPGEWKRLLKSEAPYDNIDNFNYGNAPIIKLNNSIKLVDKLINKDI